MGAPDSTGQIEHPVGGAGGDSGDSGCTLNYSLWIPAGAGPFPCVISTASGGFQDGGVRNEQANALTDMKNRGFMCMFFDVRLVKGGTDNKPGLPGQTTDGRYQQQNNDFIQGIRFIRSDPRCNGFVAGYGGSGSGYLAFWCTIFGTPGDDRLDAVIGMSPVTDFSDRDGDVGGLGGGFVRQTADFARQDPNDTSSATLAYERSISPIAGLGPDTPPIFQYNGGNETMPASQYSRFSAEVTDKGVLNYTGNYVQTSSRHAFAAWAEFGRDKALPFLDNAYQIWQQGGGGGGGGGGGEPPPIPGGDLLAYSYMLTGGPGDVTGGIIPGDATSAQISGLSPDLTYVFSIKANNVAGSGPWASASFVSDKISSGGGGGTTSKVPIGIIDHLPTVDGVLPDAASLAVWGLDYIIGVRYHTYWKVVQPTSQTEFDWTGLDEFLALCAQFKKRGAISIQGAAIPDWAIDSGVVTFTDGGGRTYPLPWDFKFDNLYATFIAAVGARYNGNTNLSYAVIGGLGRDFDTCQTYLILDTDSTAGADTTALTALATQGGRYDSIASAWEQGARQILGAYKKAFPSISVMSDLNFPVPVGTPVKDGQQALTNYIALVNSGGGKSFGYMDELLSTTTDGSNPIDFIVSSQAATRQTGYMTAGTSANSTDFQTTMNNGIALLPNFIEITDADAIKTGNYPTIIADTATTLRNNRL